MKNYLYHWVPGDMKGDILYPLNDLKKVYPELYNKKAAKYIGREKIMKETIRQLKCFWNDVLHLTAIHPGDIKKALIEAGGKKDIKIVCYRIDPDFIDPKNTVVYLYKYDSVLNNMSEDNFATYNSAEIEKYSTLPQVTFDYYKQSYANKKVPLAFHRVPHILYKGNLDIKKFPIIEV